jgi:hypothetical protein
VLIGKHEGTEIKLDGDEYLIVREDEILDVAEGVPEVATASKVGATVGKPIVYNEEPRPAPMRGVNTLADAIANVTLGRGGQKFATWASGRCPLLRSKRASRFDHRPVPSGWHKAAIGHILASSCHERSP